MDIFRFDCDGEQSELRLDQWVAAKVPSVSRTLARKIIDLGGVHVNGQRTRKCGFIPKGAAKVEVYLDGLDLEPWELSSDRIIFQDKYLIVLDKPAGVDTQPTHARYRGTLYDALLRHLQRPHRPDLKPELGMVQRLDRGTSGLIAFSTHGRSHKPLTEAFTGRKVKKTYLALVQGRLPDSCGEIRSSLVRSRNGNRMMSVAHGGREAVSLFRVLLEGRDLSLVSVEIPTGRTHQIRVHMAEQGCPLLGDSYYGGPLQLEGVDIPRPMLHSQRLELEHPVTGEALRFEAASPPDMQELLGRFFESGT